MATRLLWKSSPGRTLQCATFKTRLTPRTLAWKHSNCDHSRIRGKRSAYRLLCTTTDDRNLAFPMPSLTLYTNAYYYYFKIFEKIMYNYLYNGVYHLFSLHQHGFITVSYTHLLPLNRSSPKSKVLETSTNQGCMQNIIWFCLNLRLLSFAIENILVKKTLQVNYPFPLSLIHI